MKTIVDEDGNVRDKLSIFDAIDLALADYKWYQIYYTYIWCPIYRTFWFRPKTFFHNVKMFFQRGKLGYTHEDYWAMNYYLAKYLAGVLADWSEKTKSYPPQISGKTFTSEEWQTFLSDSKRAFERWLKWSEGTYTFDKKEYANNQKKIKRFFMILGDNFDTFWD